MSNFRKIKFTNVVLKPQIWPKDVISATESPKMVSKRVKSHYLSSNEQFLKNQIYQCNFETKSLTKTSDISPKKSKNTESPNWCQTAQNPQFKKLWAVFGKSDLLLDIRNQNFYQKMLLAPENSKILKVQKSCQNGAKSII